MHNCQTSEQSHASSSQHAFILGLFDFSKVFYKTIADGIA